MRTAFGGPNGCTEPDGTWEDFYNVTLAAQTQLRVSLVSPGLTSYLRLFNNSRTTVVNTATLQTPDTVSTAYAILPAGAYQIVVRATVPGAVGAYRMVAAADSTPVGNCSTPFWVVPGITTTQTLHNSDCTQGAGAATKYMQVYTVVLLYAEANTIAESSAVFTPSATLQGSTGTQSSTLDSTGRVATINAFTTTPSAYQIYASTANPLQTGQYLLRIK